MGQKMSSDPAPFDRLSSSSDDIAYAFGPYRFIPSRQQLTKQSANIKLGGRALDILHLLLQRAGQIVTKTELVAHAWPNVFVDDYNLKVNVSNLRRALGDSGQKDAYIATVIGHGYKFVAPVSVERHARSSIEIRSEATLPPCPDLIGRESDVVQLSTSLNQGRPLTLVGPGGAGKTGLAVALAHMVKGGYADDVIFVDMTATTDPALVLDLLAVSMGIGPQHSATMPALIEGLRSRRALIVLDNCEHVRIAVAALISALLAANSSVAILATSREPIGLAEEKVVRVEPLACPDPSVVLNLHCAFAYPATELFVLRAYAVVDWKFSESDWVAVAGICRALDGIPLAIELAAAQLRTCSPSEILSSITHELDRPKTSADVFLLHQSLWATIDWSYRLLSAEEQQIFRLLSVFVGAFDWNDAVEMAQTTGSDPHHTTVAIGSLVAKSLVSVSATGGVLRYRLLESARTFAFHQLLKDPARTPHSATMKDDLLAFERPRASSVEPMSPVRGQSLGEA